jgi:hypothetical protein
MPAIAEVSKEFRSPDFHASLSNLINFTRHDVGYANFDSLPEDFRNDVYRVCYLFDNLGFLVASGAMAEEVPMALVGVQMMRVWSAISPLIERERSYRRQTYPVGVSPGLFVYYENLVMRMLDLGSGFVPR